MGLNSLWLSGYQAGFGVRRPAIIRPVILCGGAGTRLWPLSRDQFPKQLLRLTGDQSLLQQTAGRMTGQGFAPAIIVSGEEQRFFIKRQLDESGASVAGILLEPERRNTAAAAALAACWLHSRVSDELMLLMPSDHVIADQEAFLRAVHIGAAHAEQGSIVTFGATPTEPNTQYGYIEGKEERRLPDGALPIARFHEKPDAGTAEQYLSSGHFYWNCGIFLVHASTLIEDMREFAPATLEAVEAAVAAATTDGLFVRPGGDEFGRADNISIDHAVMERTRRGVVVPVQMGWSDVGAWDAVWKLSDRDSSGNVVAGRAIALETRNSLIRSDGRAIVAAFGLNEMAVIATPDAILVAPVDRASDLKSVTTGLSNSEPEVVTTPAKVARPWGSYETVASGPGFQVKHIIVDPGERLSLQSHVQRSEHWVVVHGSAEVTLGEEVSILQQNQSTYIAPGTKHRLGNPGPGPLEIVEVQCGAYLGEDDIVRYDDEYGRACKS